MSNHLKDQLLFDIFGLWWAAMGTRGWLKVDKIDNNTPEKIDKNTPEKYKVKEPAYEEQPKSFE